MKKFLLALILFASLSASAQTQPFDLSTIPTVDGKVKYTLIDTVETKSKEDIYMSLSEWLAKVVSNSKEAIRLSDRESGKLIVKGNVSSNILVTVLKKVTPMTLNTHMTLDFTIKDGRYRLIVEDIQMENTATIIGTQMIPSTRSSFDDFVKSLKQLNIENPSKDEKMMLDIQLKYASTIHEKMEQLISDIKNAVRSYKKGGDEF